MSVSGWRSVLVLGGIRSGKSEFAESLVGDGGPVRYVATGSTGAAGDDPDWDERVAAHRERRPAAWPTEEAGDDPSRLLEIISTAKDGETLLVDDLGGWVTALIDPERQPADDLATIADLATAIRESTARLILVSSEVGLSLVPLSAVGRVYTDALGATNQAVAEVADAVALIVAGQTVWLKDAVAAVPPAAVSSAPAAPVVPATSPEVLTPAPDVAANTVPAGVVDQPAWSAPTTMLPAIATGLVIQQGMALPMPDEFTPAQVRDRLLTLDLGGAGLGRLQSVVEFAAATQGRTNPQAWRAPRVVLIRGDHNGGASAGTLPGESRRRADQARAGEGPIARLAADAGATLQVVDAPTCAAMEERAVLTAEEVEAALRYGWRLAEEASDAGVDLLVVGACGSGSEAAAAAVLAATTGAEPAAVLGRVIVPGTEIDDDAWMIRTAAVRDAMHRVRRSARSAKQVLADVGGGDIAVATGLILGATARRLPVLIDGPVGVAAALVTRDLAGQARHWCLLPDHGQDPAVKLGADVLGLTPVLDLRLGLGEGATALATLPLLRSAIALAAALPVHPAVAPDDETLAAHDSLDEPDDPAAVPAAGWLDLADADPAPETAWTEPASPAAPETVGTEPAAPETVGTEPAAPETAGTEPADAAAPETARPGAAGASAPETAWPEPAGTAAAETSRPEPAAPEAVPAPRDAGDNGTALAWQPDPEPSALDAWFQPKPARDDSDKDEPARGA
ncbi:MAG TPA: bifunctional adenosylcobinamide kinase/adenosylcobinamide-phosphate guanylyltransferase [Asanoa sp.]|nr:bifunctional adenosylcobinamide kinase/adenosylcobinamide-phosphate guanylyltransferase [Asanoa sp.]